MEFVRGDAGEDEPAHEVVRRELRASAGDAQGRVCGSRSGRTGRKTGTVGIRGLAAADRDGGGEEGAPKRRSGRADAAEQAKRNQAVRAQPRKRIARRRDKENGDDKKSKDRVERNANLRRLQASRHFPRQGHRGTGVCGKENEREGGREDGPEVHGVQVYTRS